MAKRHVTPATVLGGGLYLRGVLTVPWVCCIIVPILVLRTVPTVLPACSS